MEIAKYKYKTLLFSFDWMVRLLRHNFLSFIKHGKNHAKKIFTKPLSFRVFRLYCANMRTRANTPKTKQAHKKASLSTCLFLFLITFMQFS